MSSRLPFPQYALDRNWSPSGIYDALAVLAWKRGDRVEHRLYRQQEEVAKAATELRQRRRY